MSLTGGSATSVAKGGNFSLSNPFVATPLNSLRGNDFKDGFVVYEIEKGVQKKEASIKLVGNLMPKVPFEWGGKLRTITDYYPGNPEPVKQIIGGQEDDFTIKGRLYSKRFKDPNLYPVPYEIVELMQAVRTRGNLLHIQMGEFVRHGFLEQASFKMKNLGDIEYSLTFSVVAIKTPKSTYFIKQKKTVPFDINNALIAAAISFQSTYSTFPTAIPRSLGDLINSLVNAVATPLAAVTGYVDGTLGALEDVQRGINRGIGLIKVAQKAVRDTKRRFSALMSDPRVAALKVPNRYSQRAFFANGVSSMNDINQIMAQLRAQLRAISLTIPLARYSTKPGDTLQKISSSFYATPNEWKRIYDHNKLTSTNLVSGTFLEIPRLS